MNPPNPNNICPIPDIDWVNYIKPTITKSNIVVGEFSYFSDNNFEDQVTHHYDFY